MNLMVLPIKSVIVIFVVMAYCSLSYAQKPQYYIWDESVKWSKMELYMYDTCFLMIYNFNPRGHESFTDYRSGSVKYEGDTIKLITENKVIYTMENSKTIDPNDPSDQISVIVLNKKKIAISGCNDIFTTTSIFRRKRYSGK